MNPTTTTSSSSFSLPSSYPRYELITEAANTVNTELSLFPSDEDDDDNEFFSSDSDESTKKKKTINPGELEREVQFLRSSLEYFYSHRLFPFSNETATKDFVTTFLPMSPAEFKAKNQKMKRRYKKRMWRVCKKFQLLEDTREQDAFELGNMIWGGMSVQMINVNQEEKEEKGEKADEDDADIEYDDDDDDEEEEGRVVLGKFPLLKKKFELKSGVIKMPVVSWKGLKVTSTTSGNDDDDDRVKEWKKQQIEALKRFLSKISLARLYATAVLDKLVLESQERRASVAGTGSSNGKRMNEILPQEININVLKRLPVKSLTRFKSVSKYWATLIGTPHFITKHLHHSLQKPFLIFQQSADKEHPIFTSSFFLMGSDLQVHSFQFLNFGLPDALVVGSCNGVLCLSHAGSMLSLCNPATRQVTLVPRPINIIDDGDNYGQRVHVVFGFSSVVNDYKILAIHSVCDLVDEIDLFVMFENTHVDKVEVYSVATGSWREIDASNLQTVGLTANHVTVHGNIVWSAIRCSVLEPDFLLSFDIEKEVFTELKGPPQPFPPNDSDDGELVVHDTLVVYNEKLAMFHYFVMESSQSSFIDLWVLDLDNHAHAADGERWIKQYRVGPFSRILDPLNIWGDEIVCREEFLGHNHPVEEYPFYLFNPQSNKLKNLPTNRNRDYHNPFTYAESLVPVAGQH